MKHPNDSVYIRPPFLTEGSLIGITCPSGYVSAERVAPMVKILSSWGYRVREGATIGTSDHYFSGTDDQRLQDLQAMLDDDELDAIVMGRGGYGLSRIVDRIDFGRFLKKPKWICGFSDITVLHSHLHRQYGIQTLHAPMSGHFKPETEQSAMLQSFRKLLGGESITYRAGISRYNKPGTTTGVLTGGNLSLICHLTGSASEIETRGKILFLEDVGEYLYNTDRMMWHLKRAGKLEGLAGLVFGGFTDMKDTERPFGKTIEQILRDVVNEYEYPVCFHFPCGHQDLNYTLNLGAPHRLLVGELGVQLEKL
jgi:muramoyltetrapeptide carboxypeptidase